MPKTEARKLKDAQHRVASELTDTINAWRKRIVWDGDLGGIVNVHPWGVRKSASFDVQQIITEPRMSKLERRSWQV